MPLTHAMVIHLLAALAALALGPLALWARRGAVQRPRLHRAAGYAWVTLMLVAALSSVFIRDTMMPNIAGFSPIHLFVPVVLFGLFGAFWYLARRNFAAHRRTMQGLYFGGCIGAGLFALAPGRYLGNLLWGQWLGWV